MEHQPPLLPFPHKDLLGGAGWSSAHSVLSSHLARAPPASASRVLELEVGLTIEDRVFLRQNKLQNKNYPFQSQNYKKSTGTDFYGDLSCSADTKG